MHPLFDASSLNDQELLSKVEKFSAKIAIAKKTNSEFTLINQYQMVLNECLDEMQIREVVKAARTSNPCVFDSDSYLEKNKRDDTKENLPRWKSAVLNELSNESFEPWNSTSFDDFD